MTRRTRLVILLCFFCATLAYGAVRYFSGTLRGTGTASPRVRVVPTLTDWGTVEYPGFEDRTVQVINFGQREVSGTVSLGTGSCSQFTIVSGSGPYILPPGGSLPVVVRFTPADSNGVAVECELLCGP